MALDIKHYLVAWLLSICLDRQQYFDGFQKLKQDGFITDSLDFMNSY